MAYYLGKVKFEAADPTTGKLRKFREQYLVAAESISEAEKMLEKRFEHSISDTKVISIQESAIMEVLK